MEESIGIICRCDDPIVTSKIESFLKQLDGCKIIYFTHNNHSKLYIVDKDRLDQISRREHYDNGR